MATTLELDLADGHRAVIDRADEALVTGFDWRPQVHAKTVYVHAWHRNLHVYLHRLIIGAGTDEQVDHKNGDGLDNRLLNLRVATKSENGANRPKDTNRHRAAFTSTFKGVYWDKKRETWVAIIHDKKSRYLGRFDNEESAARAYDVAALEVWGDFARLNLP